MAMSLTERNLAICADCFACVAGNKCRYIHRQIKFKLARLGDADYWRGYYQANRHSLIEKHREYAKNNRKKMQVAGRVYYFMKTRNIDRPDSCSVCGKTRKVHAHHPNYADPYIVEWLCNGCHKKKHNGSLNINKSLKHKLRIGRKRRLNKYEKGL